MDYRFETLNPRDFQHMVQGLAFRVLGTDVEPLGDGPDGGRDLTFEGRLLFPETKPWDGYGVVQIKFRQVLHETAVDTDWAVDGLRKELEAFLADGSERRIPAYYIYATNVRLSSVPGSGGKERAERVLEEYRKRGVPVKDFRVWDNDRLRMFLDNNTDVRGRYAQFLTTSDIVESVIRPEEPTHSPSVNLTVLEDEFGIASKALLQWPTTLGNGITLHRSEHETLFERITTRDTSTTLLLGEPGSGKSALLAMLGHRACEADWHVLGLKADRLPKTVNSQVELARLLSLPDGLLPRQAVEELARDKRVVVLIDQLDALGNLVDQDSGRLDAMLQFVAGLSGRPNVHVVTSCRTFEFNHDIRLRTVGAEQLTLAPLAWRVVEDVLKEQGLPTDIGPEGMREVLRMPFTLALYLELVTVDVPLPEFHNQQSLFDQMWERRVLPPNGPQGGPPFLGRMARKMANEEVLWLPKALFPEESVLIKRLEANGILTSGETGNVVGFRHQCLFEHSLARAAISDPQEFVEFIRERADGLFVRPWLWRVLPYLRAQSPVMYRDVFGQLWETADLRMHLRHLLIEFLGQVPDPDSTEFAWLGPWLRDEKYQRKALTAVAGQAKWFDYIHNSGVLQDVMADTPERAFGAVVVLRQALPFSRTTVFGLLRQFWLPDCAKAPLAERVLDALVEWDENSVEMACTIVAQSGEVQFWAGHIASKIARGSPQLSPRVIRAALDTILAALIPRQEQPSEPWGEDDTEEGRFEQLARERTWEPYCRLIQNDHGWYDLPKLAQAAPGAFLTNVFDWYVRVIEKAVWEMDPAMLVYVENHASDLHDQDHDIPLQGQITTAIDEAVRTIATQDADAFLAFARSWQASNLAIVHRLLARGFACMAPSRPDDACVYLMGDPRRFLLGGLSRAMKDSRALIHAVASHVDARQLAELEGAIRRWSPYKESELHGEGPQAKRDRVKWTRRRRLRLLSAIPESRLTESTRVFVREEQRVFAPEVLTGGGGSRSGRIESPMTSQQMSKASDEALLNLFNVYDDATEWHHPMRWEVGGSVQASREFEAVAKDDPERAARLLLQFKPGLQERPAGTAVKALADAGYPMRGLCDLVLTLDRRGFHGEEFRTTVAWALRSRTPRNEGLPDDICAMLDRWLAEPPAAPKRTEDNLPSAPWEKPEPVPKEPSSESVLWRWGGAVSLPGGACAYLQALFSGYMLRDPMEPNRWLTALEARLAFDTDTDTWKALAFHDLQWLRSCDQERAVAFVTAMFMKCPSVLASDVGVRLVRELQEWVPAESVHAWLVLLRDGDWTEGPKAYGELLLLLHLWYPERTWEQEAVSGALVAMEGRSATSVLRGVLVGLAHTAAQAWREPEFRDRTTDILLRLIPGADPLVAEAALSVFDFADPLPPGPEALRLVDEICANPRVLQSARHRRLLKRLPELLERDPRRTLRLMRAFVDHSGDQLATMASGLAFEAPTLVSTALALHRIPDLRSAGLALFERLLELDVASAWDALTELDRKPTGGNTGH